MFDLRNVLTGWKNFAYPSLLIEEMATERSEICSVCPHSNTEYLFNIVAAATKNDPIKPIRGLGCNICGCPLSSKLRVPLERCPENRWSTYFTKTNKMNTTNIHILKEGHQKQLGDIAQAAARIAYKDVSRTIIENAHLALQQIVKQRNMLLVELQGLEKGSVKAELTRPTKIIDKAPGGEDPLVEEASIRDIADSILKSMSTVDATRIVEVSSNKKLSSAKLYIDFDEKIAASLKKIRAAAIVEIDNPTKVGPVDDSKEPGLEENKGV